MISLLKFANAFELKVLVASGKSIEDIAFDWMEKNSKRFDDPMDLATACAEEYGLFLNESGEMREFVLDLATLFY